MNRPSLTLILIMLILPALLSAQENLLSNPATPYPPGCATNAHALKDMPGRETEIRAATLSFVAFELEELTGDLLEVDVRLVRRGCAEADRSLLMVDLEVLDDGDANSLESIQVPFFAAERFGVSHLLRGVDEPNSWEAHASGRRLREGQSIRLFLDGPSVTDPDYDPEWVLTPEEYNGDWVLEIIDAPLLNAYRVNVPEYRNQLQASSLALNGRLSGIWWVPNTPDQGIFLGFHERANDPSGMVFLSWMTFGPNGENLWFAGTGDYEIGDTSVVIELVTASDGEFMGPRPAARERAGTVTLTANNCNDLTMAWALDYPGLEDGVRRLVRTFELETQGFACRDLQARQDNL